MSPLIRTLGAPMVLSLALFAFACSEPRTESGFDPSTGQHISGWLPAGHADAGSGGISPCADCHGQDYAGGISGVSCEGCHLGGPSAAHPADWTLMYRDHGPFATAAGTAGCANQYCHGPGLAGVAGSGPACTTCHSMPFDPSTVVCGACHGIPPDGQQFPDTAGRHQVHYALDVTMTCDACHLGAGDPTALHYNNTVEIAFSGLFDDKSAGAPAFDAASDTCSNISCHGGQTTPNWLSGTLDVNTQCTACHSAGTAEYNGFTSGEHTKHVSGEGIGCTQCHDTAKLAVGHFTTLQTTAMEGPASATLLNSLNYSGGSCTPSCHGQENW